MKNKIKIEVIYLSKKIKYHKQFTITNDLTVEALFNQFDLINTIPFFSKKKNKIGIFGNMIPYNYILKDKDRIEIYEPISIDPKTMRKRIANTKKKNK